MHVRSGPTMAHVLAADAKLARAANNCKKESTERWPDSFHSDRRYLAAIRMVGRMLCPVAADGFCGQIKLLAPQEY